MVPLVPMNFAIRRALIRPLDISIVIPLIYQARRRTDGQLAAAKIVDIKDDDELDDFMVEIDILSECKHRYVVDLYEAYFFDSKLWVRAFVYLYEAYFFDSKLWVSIC